MNRLDNLFSDVKKKKKKALIVYVTAGFPDLKTTGTIIEVLQEEGVGAVEIGIPFSDPIADGPTIQCASQESLKQGTTLPRIITWTRTIRRNVSIPLIYMGYFNPFFRYGMTDLAGDVEGMIDGMIIPDLSYEESVHYADICRRHDLRLIYLITPLTPVSRMRLIIRAGSGFLYAVSTTGVTGARKTIPASTITFLKTLRLLTSKPIAVGIGISHPRQIRAIKPMVDGIIVGSAFISLIRAYSGKRLINEIRRYTRILLDAL